MTAAVNALDEALAVKLGARAVRHVRPRDHQDNSSLLAFFADGGGGAGE